VREMDETASRFNFPRELEIEAAVEHNNVPQPSHILTIELNVNI
jgi:hypothetical protein